MLNYIYSRFRNITVSVEVDPLLMLGLNCPDRVSQNRTIEINLHNLIYNIGSIQTRRIAANNRNKFNDKKDLIDLIYRDSIELRVRVNELRFTGGPDAIRSISEDFGVGLSVCIASKLYNVDPTTIQRIIVAGGQKRPDWSCQTKDLRTIVVESKGSTSLAGSNAQLSRALAQKIAAVGHVKIASATLINEHEATLVRFFDPPAEPENRDPVLQRAIFRAAHYSSVFGFLGHAELSRYFGQMQKRIEKTISSSEQLLKEFNFRQIRDEYNQVEFEDIFYRGTFLEVDRNRYIFTGVDPQLIGYRGFLSFQEHERTVEQTVNENHYIRYPDGILIVEISNIRAFEHVVNVQKIANNQDNARLSDVDVMNEVSFEKLVNHLLRKIDFRFSSIGNLLQVGDIAGMLNERHYLFDLKLFNNPRTKLAIRSIQELVNTIQIDRISRNFIEPTTVVIITNANVPSFVRMDRHVIVIGREQLKLILVNQELLFTLLRF